MDVPPLATDCHAHIFDPARFPYSPFRRYTPPPATVDDLERMHDSVGLQRVVLVQPSVYGTDNDCLLDALGRLGDRARGVAVIDTSFSRARLDDLYGAGVRAVRLNLEVTKDADPRAAVLRLQEVAALLDGTPLSIQIYARMGILLACGPTMRALPRRVLIDHFAMAGAAAGPDQTGFAALRELVSGANVWIKLSGPHQISHRPPAYPDVAPIARALLAAVPTRAVWGSDWPHTGGTRRSTNGRSTDIEPFRREDDRRLLDLVEDWAPQADARRTLLVDNPAQLFGFDAGNATTRRAPE